MPRLRSLFLAVAAAGLLAGCGDEDPVAVDGDGYTFEAPSGWTEGDSDQLGEAVGADLYDTFLAGDTATNGFTENFNVVLQDNVPATLSTRRWAQLGAAQFADSRFREQIFPGAKNFKVLTPTPQPAELGGEKAFELEYSADADEGTLYFRAIMALHDGRGYIGTFASGDDGADADSAYSTIVDSWEFD